MPARITAKTPKNSPGLPPILDHQENPVLREKAKPVAAHQIGSPELSRIIADMKAVLATQRDGIAIAAPQIGVPLRIFVVSGSLLTQADPTYKGGTDDLVFINPEITRRSREKKDVEEGCLSVRWLYGAVPRSVKVSLRALDQNGAKVSRGASGLLAQIFQHEVDHLEGILFIDHADELWELTDEEIADMQN